MTTRLALFAVAGLSFGAWAQTPPDAAREAAECLTRYERAPGKELVTDDGRQRLRCMPERYAMLPAPSRAGVPPIRRCFERLATETDAARQALLEAACRARVESFNAHGLEGPLFAMRDEVRAAPGVFLHVPHLRPEHVSNGARSVRKAVAAVGETLARCSEHGADTVLLFVRAGLDEGEAVALEPAGGPLAECLATAASAARLSADNRFARAGAPWSGLVEVRFGGVGEVPPFAEGGHLSDLFMGARRAPSLSGPPPRPESFSRVLEVEGLSGAAYGQDQLTVVLARRQSDLDDCFLTNRAEVKPVSVTLVVSSEGRVTRVTAADDRRLSACVAKTLAGTTAWHRRESTLRLVIGRR